jgi:hypothetical protein
MGILPLNPAPLITPQSTLSPIISYGAGAAAIFKLGPGVADQCPADRW